MNKVISVVIGVIVFGLLLITLKAHAVAPFVIEGVVYAVHDGDTVYIKGEDGKKISIRLDQIDAPELAMPYGKQSRDELVKLVLNKQVLITASGYDKYKRAIGTIYLVRDFNQKIEINLEMVASGNAWFYTKYGRDTLYIMAEKVAKDNKLGLWRTINPQAPWIYRVAMKIDPKCGPKTTCSEMSSCTEAKKYFTCGLLSLDANVDGVPCQSLCK